MNLLIGDSNNFLASFCTSSLSCLGCTWAACCLQVDSAWLLIINCIGCWWEAICCCCSKSQQSLLPAGGVCKEPRDPQEEVGINPPLHLLNSPPVLQVAMQEIQSQAYH